MLFVLPNFQIEIRIKCRFKAEIIHCLECAMGDVHCFTSVQQKKDENKFLVCLFIFYLFYVTAVFHLSIDWEPKRIGFGAQFFEFH